MILTFPGIISRAYLPSPSPFSPAMLFGPGTDGTWGAVSELFANGMLWQDSAGTIPVTGDAQPVGRVDDPTGNGWVFEQATSANRVEYRTDGIYHWLEVNGINQRLETTGGSPIINPQGFMLISGRALSESAVGWQGIMQGQSNTWEPPRVLLVFPASTSSNPILRWQAHTTDWKHDLAVPVNNQAHGIDRVVFAGSDGASVESRVDGATVDISPNPGPWISGSNYPLRLFSNASSYGHLRMYGWIYYGGSFGPTDLTAAETWAANLYGG